MNQSLNRYKRKISFLIRKRIKKKYVMIESDDWGLERAPNSEVLAKILLKYKHLNPSRWTFDCLESMDDLNVLFDLLSDYQTKFESTPIITANFITHNLEDIREDKAIYKPISKGFVSGDAGVIDGYRKGIASQMFFPQLHGYSHYNTSLIEKEYLNTNFREDCSLGFPLALTTFKGNLGLYRGECFDANFEQNIKEAATIFQETFGYPSKTFIPPNYWYNFNKNPILKVNKIDLLQSTGHFISEKQQSFITPFFRSKNQLLCSTRNCRLDVHSDYNYNSEFCIKGIERAFENEMPAIIDIHRVNFSGTYAPETRIKTLQELKKVLDYIYWKHPEVRFITSAQFSERLKNNQI